MLYVRLCYDAPGMGSLRDELRAAHRAYLKPFVEGERSARVVQAGALCISDIDDTQQGSCFIVEASSRAELHRFHEEDPFTKAGIYGRVEMVRWSRAIGN